MPATKTTLSPTLTKAEACAALGKSKRTIDNYVAAGRLAAEYVSGPNGREARFERAAVERLKRELDTPLVRAVLPRTPREASAHTGGAPPPLSTALATRHEGGPDRFMTALLGKLVALTPPRVKPWLDLDEAAEYSGLPKAWLLAQARAAAAFARNVGSEKRAVWRFSRAGLR